MTMQNDFEEQYKNKLCTAEEIAELVESGCGIYIDAPISQPREIMRAIGERAERGDIHGLSMNTLLDVYPAAWFDGKCVGSINGVSWFSGSAGRRGVNAGFVDVMPAYYRDMPRVIRDNPYINCVCAAVSSMDRHGYFSLAATSSCTAELLSRADKIYLEVNKNLPRTLTAPLIHVSRATAICESDYRLPVTGSAELDEVSAAIGRYIAEETPDGATIQLGIGAVPDAVGLALKTKRGLGIHTELFTDSMVELIECGAVTNLRKPINTGRSVATFAFGSQRVYDYINDNPSVMILPVDYVNEPKIIALHPNFISVNAAIEVDFYGQVCAESVGTRHISGTGGQVDYVRGAVESSGGKSFIAFPSTTDGGKVSRIVPTLKSGAIVTTSKNDVDRVVTEYGIAELRGRTLSQRTKALISVAHPKFRDELTFSAKKENIII
ncbi:MAG: acetyl-CoA hydrolase/transferase C-terminal domain-containing protein [Oscillospiraceae bacterium]|nr:acetyl-CoA hydrolase/transferase C-terminal domain-containing protein [Oscillospiraceae bacterium]